MKLKRVFKFLIKISILALIIYGVVVYWNVCEDWTKRARAVYYVMQGDAAMDREDLLGAIDFYKKGLALYPDYTTARCNLGNIFVMYEDYEAAVENYRMGLKDPDKNIACRMNLGIVLSEKLLQYDEAIDEYEKIVNAETPKLNIPYITEDAGDFDKNKGLAYYNMGIAYHYKSILVSDNKALYNSYAEKSAKMYEEANKLIDDDYNIAYNYALANQILGDTRKAKEGYCAAIKISPMQYEAHYNLALLLAEERNYKAALEEMEKTTLLMDYVGNISIAKYIFRLYAELTKKVMQTKGGKEYLLEQADKKAQKAKDDGEIIYKNGKISVSDKYDEIMYKNFQTCSIDDII